MKKILYQLRDVSYAYGDTNVLNSVSLTIYEGDKIAIVGANGCGKSTLLKLLNGLMFPTTGEVLFKAHALTEEFFLKPQHEYEFRKSVGFVFQDPDVQLFNQTVLDEVRFGPLHMGVSLDEVDRRVRDAMNIAHVAHLTDRSPFTLSGGEKKRVSLASILSMRPSVWLMDEPLASLDPRSQSAVIHFMNEAVQRNETIILSTHDIILIHELANRVIVLSEDHMVVADITPNELLRRKQFLQMHNLTHVHSHGGNSGAHTHMHTADMRHTKKPRETRGFHE